jgi:tetratricopeptide (TPR) repeat protein
MEQVVRTIEKEPTIRFQDYAALGLAVLIDFTDLVPSELLFAVGLMPVSLGYEAAISLAPHSIEAVGQYLDFLTANKQIANAVVRAQQYAAANGNDARALNMLSSVLLRAGKHAEAKQAAERAIHMDPKLVVAYLTLGKIHQELHENDAAIARYEKALSLQPNFPPLQTLIGNIYLEKGDLGRARAYFEQALGVNPNFAIAAANLAWVYTKQGGNLDVALGLAQRAKQLQPNVDSITDTLAWVQFKKGNTIQAKPLLQDCVRKAPERASYHYHLGMVLLASGERQKAKSELESALRLKLPADEANDARQALARLR